MNKRNAHREKKLSKVNLRSQQENTELNKSL